MGRRGERTENMYRMLVTLDVSKVSGWLKTAAELNMLFMSVTLEVSKLSGRLNACVFCRVQRGAC